MRRRAAERARSRALIDGLNAIADALRGGASLRQAFVAIEAHTGSPFQPVAAALVAGRPLVPTLHAASLDADAELASVCCVLAVHAEAGGDPLPACAALAERIARRQTAADEARALTTQARLGARTILSLTPVFLLVVAASDPQGAVAWIGDERTRIAMVSGIALQVAGAWWIAAIIRGAAGHVPRSARVPVVRAVRAIFAGRSRTDDDEDVASTADLVALVLDAGLSATAAVCAVAPYARARFGETLREAVSDTGSTLADAVGDRMGALGSGAADRFARAVAASTDLGVPLAPSMRALAEEIRQRGHIRVAEDIRRASVRVLVPLGALVLPAFVLACLVPLFTGGLDGISGR